MGPSVLRIILQSDDYLATAKLTKVKPVDMGSISVEQISESTVLQIPRYPSVTPHKKRIVIAT